MDKGLRTDRKGSDPEEDVDESKDIGIQTKKGIIYTVVSNGGQFGLRFLGSIILARVLFPEDFGLMAIISIIMQLATRLTNFGFTMVLVQRKKIQKEHLETVFVTNLCLMSLLTLGVYFSAPFIAGFFENAKVEPIVKVIAFNFILFAFTSVPRAILRRKMQFKELEISISIGKFIHVFIPVCLALAGFGVWALVFGILCENAFLALLLMYNSRWVPRFKFDFWALKDVFSFGLWVYIAGYVNYAINKVDFFTVGKVLNVTQLGFYERAFNLMSLPRQQIAQRIGSVMFSSYARIQDDPQKTLDLLIKVLLYISLITYPLMVWMFFTAPALIINLFGEKWAPSIYPFQIMCMAGILDTLTLVLEPIATARGYIGNRVRRDMVYFLILSFCVFLGARWGITGVAWGTTAASIIRLFLMLTLIQKILPFSVTEFFHSQKSALVYSLLLAFILFVIKSISANYISITSGGMLLCMSVAAVSSLVISHYFFRFKDAEAVRTQLYSDLRGMRKKFSKS